MIGQVRERHSSPDEEYSSVADTASIVRLDAPPPRISNLDGFRAVASLAVVVYHAAGFGLFLTPTNSGAHLADNLGNFGVAVFFLLSGVVIFLPFVSASLQAQQRPSTARFLSRRAVRILPAYWVALLVWAISTPQSTRDVGTIAGKLLLTDPYDTAINYIAGLGVAWTLTIEISFYVMVPVYAALVHLVAVRRPTRGGWLAVHVGGLTLLYLAATLYRTRVDRWQNAPTAAFSWLPNFLDWFALGMLLALLVAWRRDGGRLPRAFVGLAERTWACWSLSLACYFVVVALKGDRIHFDASESTAQMAWRMTFQGLAAFFLLLPGVFGRSDTTTMRLFGTKPMVFLGTISYGIYLWHIIVLAWISPWFETHQPGQRVLLTLLVTLSITLPIATASYYVIEKPLGSLLTQSARRDAPAALTVQRHGGDADPTPTDPTPTDPTPTTPTWRRRRMATADRNLAIVVAVAFVVRLIWLAFALRPPVGLGDSQFYLETARSVAAGRGYLAGGHVTALWPPGYPLVLGAAFVLLPFDDILVAGALNLVLGTATVLLVGLLARRMLGERSAVVAALIVAFFPSMVMFGSSVLTETLSNFLVVAMLTVLLWRPWRSGTGILQLPSWQRVGAAGLIGGAAVLVRPTFVGSLVLVPVAWWLARGTARQVLMRGGVLLAAAFLVVLPWTVRNAVQMDAFIPVSTNTGINLCIGNNPEATGGFGLPAYCFDGLTPDQTTQGEVQRDATLRQRGVDWMTSNLAEQPRLVVLRTMQLFSNDSAAVVSAESFGNDPWLDPQHSMWLRWIADAYFWAVFTLAVLGFIVWRRRADPRVLALLMVVAGVIVITWPFFGDGRFKQPMLPVLALAATVALKRLLVEPEASSDSAELE